MIRLKEEISDELQAKLDSLEDHLRSLGSLAVGFSGGVDSSFLLAAAKEVLGDRVIAVTAADASVPEREIRNCSALSIIWSFSSVISSP